MLNLDEYDYQIPLERFKELLADDGMVQDGSIIHTAESISHELVGSQFIEEFTEFVRSVLDEDPNNVLDPERIAARFVELVQGAADFYHAEEVH